MTIDVHSSPQNRRPPASEANSRRVIPVIGLAALTAAVLWFGLAPVPAPPTPNAAARRPGVLLSAAAVATPSAQADPLPSWNEGPTKQSILDFVAKVTRQGSDTFVPVPERVAVFDHDGTLVCEKPLVYGMVLIDRIRALAELQPELGHEEPFATLLTGDIDFVRRLGTKYFLDLMFTTLAGVSEEKLENDTRQFLATARHPVFDVPFGDVTYQPMKELISLLRSHDFSVWICSGSDVHFMRPAAEAWYGIGPDRVIASRAATAMREIDVEDTNDAGDAEASSNRRLQLVVMPHLLVLNDKERKPVSIGEQIGRRPIFAAGNVGAAGDIEMLRWSQSSRHPSLQLMVLHDDAEREMAYGETSNDSLEAAEKYGWNVVRMATDWTRVFARSLEKKNVVLKSLAAAAAVPAADPLPALPPPVRWAEKIAAFERADREQPPAEGGVVFIGSSNISLWNTLDGDFPGMNAVNRGVGGSQLTELATLANRLVPAALKPKAVVVSAGSNDIATGATPEAVRDAFALLVKNLRTEFPEVKLVFVAITPSEKRWEQRDPQQKANEAVRALIAAQPPEAGLTYMDTNAAFLGSDGLPAVECFLDDKLHPSTIGNARRAAIMRPILEEMMR